MAGWSIAYVIFAKFKGGDAYGDVSRAVKHRTNKMKKKKKHSGFLMHEATEGLSRVPHPQ